MKGINKGPPRETHSREFVLPLESKRQKKEASLLSQKVKNLPARQETRVQSLGQEDPLEKRKVSTPVFLPGEFHGQRSLVGYSPWGLKEVDMTEQLTPTRLLGSRESWSWWGRVIAVESCSSQRDVATARNMALKQE